MKIFSASFFAIFLFFTFSVNAQIPNGDFELWNNGEPVGWLTSNSAGITTEITQTQDVHGGSSALKAEAVLYNNNVQEPLVQAGEAGQGISVTQKYANLTGYYKLNSNYNDILLIGVEMYSNGNYIGFGYSAFADASSYTNFVIPIVYAYPDIPDSCVINFSVTNDTSWIHAGTTFYLDDITFQGIKTSVEQNSQITSYRLYQNYPNPFNPTTTIKYSIPSAEFVTLKIFDVLGNEVVTLVNEEKPAGNYESIFVASNLSSGVYFYTLKAGNFSSTKKLVLLR